MNTNSLPSAEGRLFVACPIASALLIRLLVIDEATSRQDLVLTLCHFAWHKEMDESPPINFLLQPNRVRSWWRSVEPGVTI